MKITYNTTGFLNESAYSANLKSFLEQYDDRFPGIEYLHLELEDTAASFTKSGAAEQLYYSSNGKMLKIRLSKWGNNLKPTLFEMYGELRNIFDQAVEEHLKSHQHYLRYAPEV